MYMYIFLSSSAGDLLSCEIHEPNANTTECHVLTTLLRDAEHRLHGYLRNDKMPGIQ